MGFVIQRQDGTRDGLGDAVVFATEEAAWEAARNAFGRDTASDVGGVESWLEVVEADDLVTVETMPDWLRASHRQARNWGVYPHNGAERRQVTREEAEAIVAADEDGYDHIVADRSAR